MDAPREHILDVLRLEGLPRKPQLVAKLAVVALPNIAVRLEHLHEVRLGPLNGEHGDGV